MECTFIKPADDTKLGEQLTGFQGKAATLNNRNGLEKWTNRNFIKFKGDICRIPHHGRRSLLKCYRLGTVWEADVLKGVYATEFFQNFLLILGS